MLSLSAAGQWEKQRETNQAKIDGASCTKIREALKSLNEYKRTCELHEVSYYDSFKLQREVHDFNANVSRLELAGLWDEIVEMLRRRELPDGFESRQDWVNLGTLYRRLVEPLDIANYYTGIPRRRTLAPTTSPSRGGARPRNPVKKNL